MCVFVSLRLVVCNKCYVMFSCRMLIWWSYVMVLCFPAHVICSAGWNSPTPRPHAIPHKTPRGGWSWTILSTTNPGNRELQQKYQTVLMPRGRCSRTHFSPSYHPLPKGIQPYLVPYIALRIHGNRQKDIRFAWSQFLVLLLSTAFYVPSRVCGHISEPC